GLIRQLFKGEIFLLSESRPRGLHSAFRVSFVLAPDGQEAGYSRPLSKRRRMAADIPGQGDGAQGRNRTTDTAIFSRLLYQRSSLGILVRPSGLPQGSAESAGL